MSIVNDGTAEIMLQPVRFKIIECLQQAGEPLYIEQIAEKVNESPRLTSHHLDILEDLGLVGSEFKLIEGKSGRPAAGRYFSVTPKLAVALSKIGEAISVKVEKQVKST